MPNATESTKDKINRSGNLVKQEAQGVVENSMNAVETISQNMGERAGEFYAKATSSANEYFEASCDYVKKNPVKGVGIAAATGLVLGSLITSAMSRKH